MAEITVLNPDFRTALGESPVWDAQQNRLLVADIIGCTITALSPEGVVLNVWHFPSEVGSFGLCRSGAWVVALRDRIIKYDWRARRITPLCVPGPEPAHNRFNDGKIGPDGAFWVGTMDDRTPRAPTGSLYRVTADGGWTRICDGLYTSNGIAWTEDGRTMLHSDSGAPWIDAWDFDPVTGTASNRRRVHTPDAKRIGRPDGAAFDLAGTYWSAGVRAGRINRFADDGTLLGSDPFPCPGVTMPCFGGPDRRTLYWTSLRHPLGTEAVGAHPLLGAVFAMPAPEAGVPVPLFAD
jgi:sugar lactone lactonase YvrE